MASIETNKALNGKPVVGLAGETPLVVPTEPLPQDDELEADTEGEYFSDDASETTSINSALYAGYIENGRRYQNTIEKEYFMPSDAKQYETESLTHVVYLILDCQRENPLFRSKLPESATNVLDLGSGSAEWAIAVAETFPNLHVRGVDLSPPPQTWVPQNCTLEVDDISQPWTWNTHFDFIHIRYLVASFDEEGFAKLYKRAYDNLAPGGWIEQMESDVGFYTDDNSIPSTSVLLLQRPRFLVAGRLAGRPLDTLDTMRAGIEAAGFINVQQQDYKVPVGSWPKHPVYRDAGRVKKEEMKAGLEGWGLFLLTKFGTGEGPWELERALDLLNETKRELDKGYHVYQRARRVWAQKPWGDAHQHQEKGERKVSVEEIVNLGYPREHHQHYQHQDKKTEEVKK